MEQPPKPAQNNVQMPERVEVLLSLPTVTGHVQVFRVIVSREPIDGLHVVYEMALTGEGLKPHPNPERVVGETRFLLGSLDETYNCTYSEDKAVDRARTEEGMRGYVLAQLNNHTQLRLQGIVPPPLPKKTRYTYTCFYVTPEVYKQLLITSFPIRIRPDRSQDVVTPPAEVTPPASPLVPPVAAPVPAPLPAQVPVAPPLRADPNILAAMRMSASFTYNTTTRKWTFVRVSPKKVVKRAVKRQI
jgi:hypothetical protein